LFATRDALPSAECDAQSIDRFHTPGDLTAHHWWRRVMGIELQQRGVAGIELWKRNRRRQANRVFWATFHAFLNIAFVTWKVFSPSL
jgi:hypothetical protein